MVWATPRKAPIKLYDLFEDHPERRIGYNPNPIIKRKIIKEKSIWSPEYGIAIHPNSIKANWVAGEIEKTLILLFSGEIFSLKNNFTASAKGWSKPTNETLFGPFRDCLSPKILRSIRVKKATFTKTGIITHNIFKPLIRITLGNHLHDFNVTLFLSYKSLYK